MVWVFDNWIYHKRENINIQKKIALIESLPDLKDKDKKLFVELLNKTQKTIPLLTNEDLLENETIFGTFNF